MATIQDLGKVAYFNRGAYSGSTTYEINDVVSYNGSSYVSLDNDNRGNLPTNTTYWSVVAAKGDKGDTGKPFVIEKTYESIEEMVADYDNMQINDYVMIQGDIEEEQNATLWTKTETEASPYKWVYLADFSGASGITGQTPNIQIGTVSEGNEPSVTRRTGSTNENPILDFVLKTGAQGETGATGNGISSISKTGTSGLVDTYTVTYTNGNSTTFTVTNGKGISSIAKTGTSGLVDTYTITYNDGSTSTYTVTNGEDGEVTQEEFDRLKMIYNILPTSKETETLISIDNTGNMPIKSINLNGNTSQETTSISGGDEYDSPTPDHPQDVHVVSGDNTINICGKNLFNNKTPNINQITWTPTENGGFFTSSTYWRNLGNKFELDTNSQYTFSFGARNSTSLYYYIKTYTDNTYGTAKTTIVNDGTALSKTFTPDSKYVSIYFSNSGALDNVEIPNIQLEKNSTATTYEPYTGSAYPINLGSMELCKIGDYKDRIFKSSGANLINDDFTIGYQIQTQGQIYENQYWNANANFFKVQPNTQYSFVALNTGSNNQQQLCIAEYSSNTENSFIIRTQQLISANYLTITTSATTQYVRVAYNNGYGVGNYMLVLGNTIPTTYDPYGAYWYKYGAIGKTTDTSGSTEITIDDMVNNGSIYSYYGGSVSGKTITYDSAISGTNTIYYPLATPTYTQITDATLISQLNALEKSYSYDKQTNISQANTDSPFYISAEMFLDLKNILNDVETRIAVLETE